MKILIISVDFAPHRDGVSTLSYHYARRLAERGHDVRVVGPRAEGDRILDPECPFCVWRFPGYEWGTLRLLPFICWSKAALFLFRPDVVLPMTIAYGGWLCLVMRTMLRYRYVTVAYAYEFLKVRRNPLLRGLYRRIYARSEFTIAISRYTESQLVAFGVAGDAIRILHPGVVATRDERPHPRDPRSPHPPTLGTCGRIIRRKGHDTVIRALPEILACVPDAVYRIAGDGPERRRLHALAGDLGVAGHVEFLGEVPDAELPDFYRSLDVFVMPSRDDRTSGHAEGFGIVYLEAAVAGVPSIGARTGGIPEAIVDGETGLLVAPDAPEALADAVIQMLTDEHRRRQFGDRAEERALREFTWDAQVDRLHDWLSELEPSRS